MAKLTQEPIFENEKLIVNLLLLRRAWKKTPIRVRGYEIVWKSSSEKKFFWKKNKEEFIEELKKKLDEEGAKEVISKIEEAEKSIKTI